MSQTLPSEFELVTDAPTCCGKCRDAWEKDAHMGFNTFWIMCRPMIVCSNCGNKRCPKAYWHEYRCTGSNEPNQDCVLDQETAYA